MAIRAPDGAKKVTDISIDIVRGIKYVSNLKKSVALSMAVLGVVHTGHFGHVGQSICPLAVGRLPS